ncbi:hypothetical protein DM02DRAFT_437982 [Periconia macrospinosa]|uniref:Secreted protein n=1 Tax=Periconia macrospinosa TaxID=97972 RepID=A0A2V1DNN5_9PLEO|nr:hypothetical protein DM02DRAFT_437982 [Periconia macrospinosa]
MFFAEILFCLLYPPSTVLSLFLVSIISRCGKTSCCRPVNSTRCLTRRKDDGKKRSPTSSHLACHALALLILVHPSRCSITDPPQSPSSKPHPTSLHPSSSIELKTT